MSQQLDRESLGRVAPKLAELSEQLHARLNIHPDDVMVIIQFSHTDDWRFSGGGMFLPEAL